MARRKGNAICGNLPWSAQDEATFVEMMMDQKTYAQIGRALGRTEKAVEQHAYTYRTRLKGEGKDASDFGRHGERKPRAKPRQQKAVQPEPVYESGTDRTVELLTYTAIFTGGCLVAMVFIAILLTAYIAIL